MVHALQETWRVLVSHGILIDVRPISGDAQLEIITHERSESTGIVDMSPGIASDIAADDAINDVIQKGAFKNLEMEERFDVSYYWTTVEEMKAYVDDKWKNDAILSDDVVNKAQTLFNNHRAEAGVRIRFQMKLIKLEKR